MDIYVYKMTVDSGGAPCVTRNLLSLAICKPQIRARAKQGSLIFGFGANDPPMSRRLIYIAEITDPPIKNGMYYRNYRNRADCIYEWRKTGTLKWRRRSRFHKRGVEAKTDIGVGPLYPKAAVLLSGNFRYFGKAGTTDYVEKFPIVGRAIKKVGRAYRVHHSPNLHGELLKLKEYVWQKYGKMKVGTPTTYNPSLRCNTASSLLKVC
jgi:Nucleotide modification associated domain 2